MVYCTDAAGNEAHVARNIVLSATEEMTDITKNNGLRWFYSIYRMKRKLWYNKSKVLY